MNLLVTVEHRFNRLPDGSVWTDTFSSRSFFDRYFAVFTSVSVIARVREASSVSPKAKRVDGDGVSVIPVSYYVGPWQYLLKRAQVRRDIRSAANREGAVILRVSSQIGNALEPHLRAAGRPYALEIVGDPYDTFAPGSVHHPLRPFFQWWFPRILRRQCARANATAYVTAEALQRRYPPKPGTFTTHYSSVELGGGSFLSKPRSAPPADRPIRIIMVAVLEQMYKAPDVLLRAVSICARKGLRAELTFLGGGRQTPVLESLARELGVAEHVRFLGAVPGGEAVREHLDSADLFVLPSRQEGLPRAMIEAMARGLPCIGSDIGGIPELLDREYIVPPNNADALADKIFWLAKNPSQMQAASARNLERAKEYRDDVLARRRNAFYRHVRDLTEDWMTASKQSSKREVAAMHQESSAGGFN